MITILQAAIGGAIGASARYLTGAAMVRLIGHGFPYGTLFVNVVGSFLMGLLAFWLMERMDGSYARYAPFLMTGVLGGFTTFSAFSLDALYLMERGRHLAAAGYVGGSVILSIGALALGIALARSIA